LRAQPVAPGKGRWTDDAAAVIPVRYSAVSDCVNVVAAEQGFMPP
jgi:hypothetical protein